jgi:hypothetical protein
MYPAILVTVGIKDHGAVGYCKIYLKMEAADSSKTLALFTKLHMASYLRLPHILNLQAPHKAGNFLSS